MEWVIEMSRFQISAEEYEAIKQAEQGDKRQENKSETEDSDVEI